MFKNWKANNARRVDFPASTLLQIPKSKWGYLRKIKMFGDTTQIQTEQGKNLFDKNPAVWASGYYDDNNDLIPSTFTAHLINLIPVSANTAYTWTGTKVNVAHGTQSRVLFYNGNSLLYRSDNIPDGSAVFITPNNCDRLRLQTSIFFITDGTFDTHQLELGSTATDYEPFTPNSPSPDYPSPIENVPSELNITSCGRNLWDAETMWQSIINANPTNAECVVFEGRRCIKTTASGATARTLNFSYGFKKDVRYRFRFDKYRAADSTSPGTIFIIIYTDGTIEYVGTGSQVGYAWKTHSTVSSAGKSVSHIKITHNGTFDNYFDLDSFQIIESVDDIPYTPYQGTTTPITLRDTEGNYHTLKSLPDGTRDEVDLDGGESVERVRRLVVTSGTSPYGFTFYSISDTVAALHFNDTANPFGYVSTNLSRRCNIAKPIGYGVAGGFGCDGRVYDTQISLFILKSKITDAGFTLDNTGAQSYIDKIIADNDGQPIIFDYPLATPKPWTLHPDERKKIITVDSDTAYVYTNAEVQPELSVNVISYGDDET